MIALFLKKCECGWGCDYQKSRCGAEVRADQSLKCGCACATQQNISQPNVALDPFFLAVGQNNFGNKLPFSPYTNMNIFSFVNGPFLKPQGEIPYRPILLKIATQLLTLDFENSSSLQLVCVYMVDGRFQTHNSAKYGSID